MEPKLVITALSSISALGKTGEMLASLAEPPKIGAVQEFGFHKLAKPQPCFQLTGFDPEAILGKKGLRTKDRATKLLLATIETGFKELFDSTAEDRRPGICIGTMFGSVQSIGDFLSDAIVNGAHNVNPMAFANTVINAPTSNANIRYVSRMSSSTVATGFNAGIDAIIYACNYIRAGHADCIIAGGLEEISYYGCAGLAKSGVLSASGAMMPFGASADGFIPGEGCAVFYIETEEHAALRGAAIIAEIAGFCACFDPLLRQDVGGSGEGMRYAMNQACAIAGIGLQEIGFIAASANGNSRLDAAEAKTIAGLFPETRVAAYKAKTGECLGAGGALSLACAITDMKNETISGTGGAYQTLDACNVVVETVTGRPSESVMINSFSCDGYCSSLIVKNTK